MKHVKKAAVLLVIIAILCVSVSGAYYYSYYGPNNEVTVYYGTSAITNGFGAMTSTNLQSQLSVSMNVTYKSKKDGTYSYDNPSTSGYNGYYVSVSSTKDPTDYWPVTATTNHGSYIAAYGGWSGSSEAVY